MTSNMSKQGERSVHVAPNGASGGFRNAAAGYPWKERRRNGHILFWILFGIIVGAVARWIVPGEGPGGILGDMIVGIVGAVIGGWIFSLFGHPSVTGLNLGSFVCALIGAVVLLWIVRAISGRRSAV